MLAKLHDLTAEMTAEMDADDFFDASAAIRSFLEVVTNWYIRRSRDRFWEATRPPSTPSAPCSKPCAGWRPRCCRS